MAMLPRRSIVLYVRAGADAAVLFASGFFIPSPISYCRHEFSFVFRDRFQQSLILCWHLSRHLYSYILFVYVLN